jgi:hypothetical protein
MHHVLSVEIERRKGKATEVKFEGFQSIFGKAYSRKNGPQTIDTNKYKYILPHIRDNKRSLEAQRMKEVKCKCCRERWDPRHRCCIEDSPKKIYTCEEEGNDELDT